MDPRLLADDAPFPEPTALILTPDHYLLRMLYSQGVPLERLGIRPQGRRRSAEQDPRKVWQVFGENYRLFRGTPSDAWLSYEFYHVFGVRTKLSGATAQTVYDEIAEKLASPEFRPRALFERFRVEVLATTDAATDPLEHHARIRASGWKGRVIPTFRPDLLLQIAAAGWRAELDRLGAGPGAPHRRLRRVHPRARGAPGVLPEPGREGDRPRRDGAVHRAAARVGGGAALSAGPRGARRGRGSAALPGAHADGDGAHVHGRRDGDAAPRRGRCASTTARCSSASARTSATTSRSRRSTRATCASLLNAYGNDPRFRLIVFTLDESTYARELAPLAGHYPAMRLGPAWWFHDSIEGMQRYRQRTTETAGIYNTAGFNDDTRGFCSIPARHDLSRRFG